MNNRNFVNLNINPCKMCMPMGAVTAFKGIENSMMILHGSQGCSTYIRRHMAGHYNEPIDIASSSLNEDGTVFGGEKNLKKGLENIIKQYEPEIIGVATTCLAETIGEDIERIVREFENSLMGNGKDESDKKSVRIIPVSTPGYGGSQFEGFHAALLSLVRKLAFENVVKNEKINVVVSSLNPGDVRNIKRVLELFQADYILLPDVSETLDAPYNKEYKRIPKGGTPAGDIALMAGAKATIEIGMTVDEKYSCGEYLNRTFGVPLYKCAIPIGIENTDSFVKLVSTLTGKPVPLALEKERGRFLDAMIDSHKFNAEVKAVLFGEPELVYSIAGLCFENGIKPVLISTGAKNEKLNLLISEKAGEFKPVVLDDTDFETIEALSIKLGANLLIGNSDGKIITERAGIPLVRIGFPIHDRVGGQRQICTFYDGSVRFMDEITNTLLDTKYSGYRKNMLENIYDKVKAKEELESELLSQLESKLECEELTGQVGLKKDTNGCTDSPADHAKNAVENLEAETVKIAENARKAEIEKKTEEHPCYGKGACSNARMHIPIAPACNISCNYCNRKFDCVNESRPGVTSEILSPVEAAAKFKRVRQKVKNLKVIGIAGPGDALANYKNTREAIMLIKEIDPDITFCLSTNGLMLPYFADELVELGVTHVTVTINAVDPVIAARIYKEINFMGKKLTGVDGCRILLRNQLAGLKQLTSKGVVCKVNIVMIKGLNEDHIEEVVKVVKACGAYMTNIMPLIPAKGSAFETYPQTSNQELNDLRRRCGVELKQMYHCKQCRADAIGTLEEDVCHEFSCKGGKVQPENNEKSDETINEKINGDELGGEKGQVDTPSVKFAVATKFGMMIDQHFGHSEEFHIYGLSEAGIHFIEKRAVKKFCGGQEECEDEASKLETIMDMISDCSAVLVMRIGHNPLKALEERGIVVVQTCGRIEDCIKTAAESIKVHVL